MRKTVMNFLLVLGGTIGSCEFFIILSRGKVYPIPNILALLVYSLLIIGIMIFAFRTVFKRAVLGEKFFNDEIISGSLLFSMGVGFLISHTIFPIIYLAEGWTINFYYGHEPIKAIAIGELSWMAAMGLYGAFNLFKSLRFLRIK